MLSISRPILQEAERAPGALGAIRVLRRMGLDDFGLFLLSLPNKEYPSLSKLLPAMADAEVQKKWNGEHGPDLLKKSVAFMRLVESAYMRHAGTPLSGKKVLDFGCGYGRLTRLLYFFTDPSDIIGADAWDVSLGFCRTNRMLGTFVKTDPVPNNIDISRKVDLAIAFSIFTHLSETSLRASLKAIRNCMTDNGLLVATIRPVEFWAFMDSANKTRLAPEMEKRHVQSGYAFVAQQGEHYGDTSMTLDFLSSMPGWTILSAERSLVDLYQVIVTLRPK